MRRVLPSLAAILWLCCGSPPGPSSVPSAEPKQTASPELVARFEAQTQERLQEIQGLVVGWLESQGIHV